ncbi:hypothetical protein C8Q75DRAFT_557084 [Abortiporus biennis]|nr:hypothetical protein C8Q75DRAFT_557084 [Abortiporus biennis]
MVAQYEECVRCWENSIAALIEKDSEDKLTAAEVNQKEQYQIELTRVTKKIQELKATPIDTGVHLKEDSVPWVKAEAIIGEIRSRGVEGSKSSAWVILAANQEFTEGYEKMKLQKSVDVPGVGTRWSGVGGALVSLSNGIMRDPRIFHVADPKWLLLLNQQGVIVYLTDPSIHADHKSTNLPKQSLRNVNSREGGKMVVRRML